MTILADYNNTSRSSIFDTSYYIQQVISFKTAGKAAIKQLPVRIGTAY